MSTKIKIDKYLNLDQKKVSIQSHDQLILNQQAKQIVEDIKNEKIKSTSLDFRKIIKRDLYNELLSSSNE